jgi:hypothetical protein
MPTQATIAITPGSGQLLDAVSLLNGASQTVVRETMVIADPSSETQLAGVTAGGALQVDGSATTQPVSIAGDVEVVQATAADFNATIVGTDADNAANSTTKLPTIPARANASAPSWTEGHEVPLSTDLSGNLRVSITDSTSTTAVTQATASNLNAQVQGTAAADAAASGNPVLIGGVDNSGNIQELPVVDTGTAVTAQVLLVGGTDGANGRQLLTDASGRVTVIGSKTNNNAAPGATNIGALVAIANAAGQVWTEGDQVTLSTDLNGSARMMAGVIPESTAAWTSATGSNTTLQVNCAGYSSIIVTLNQGTTITGGAVTFEVSDTTAFTNAYAVVATQINTASASNAYTLVANTNASFNVPVAGWAAFRIRLSTVISGTGTVNVGIMAIAGTTVVSNIAYPGGSTQQVRSNAASAALADNQVNENFFSSSTSVNNPLAVGNWAYGGAFSGTANAALQGWNKARTPTVFTTVQATASGATTVWTPGSGNKWRLLKLYVEVTQNASLAAGAVLTITFLDSAAAIPIAFDVFVPTTAVTTAVGAALDVLVDLGQFGILSSTANNTFRVNLSAALATGNVRINAMGVEE